MRDVYDIVRDFFRDGPPASRNVAFEAYQDARFAEAVRIYQYLASVRDQVLELVADGRTALVEVERQDARVLVRVRYERGQIRRTAYLKPEEWALLVNEPGIADLLASEPGLADVLSGALPG